jgi:hypothetical protein
MNAFSGMPLVGRVDAELRRWAEAEARVVRGVPEHEDERLASRLRAA